MLMMKIEMNADKILAEQRYTMSAINRTIESAFAQMQLRKVENASGACFIVTAATPAIMGALAKWSTH